jgi:hypothetical protein
VNPFQVIERNFGQLDRNLRQLERRIAGLEWNANTKEIVDAQIKVFSAVYEKARTYTNLVIVAGYAGFFGLWSLTREYLAPRSALIAAALMGISIAGFVFFEIAQMIFTTIVSQRKAKVLFRGEPTVTAPDLLSNLRDLDATNMRAALFMAQWWVWTLIPTVAFGLAATVLLLTCFVIGIARS